MLFVLSLGIEPKNKRAQYYFQFSLYEMEKKGQIQNLLKYLIYRVVVTVKDRRSLLRDRGSLRVISDRDFIIWHGAIFRTVTEK